MPTGPERPGGIQAPYPETPLGAIVFGTIAGAVITAAWIQFKADEAQSETTPLLIQAQLIGNAPAFGTATNNVSSRVA